MGTNWSIVLCIAALVICTRLKLADSTPKTWHEDSHSESSLADEGSTIREEKTLSSKPFFDFLNIFPRFWRHSPTVKSSVENKNLHSTYPAPPKFGNDGNHSEADSFKKLPLSENRPRALIRARELRLSTPLEQPWSPLLSEGSHHPPSVPLSPRIQHAVIGVADNAGVSRSSGVEKDIYTRESYTATFDKDREEQHGGSLGNFKVSAKIPVESEILSPVMPKQTDLGESKSLESNRNNHENTYLAQVSRRIRAYAEKLSSMPKGKTFVKISEARIPYEQIANVGDVDGNRVQDYIVTNIAAKNYSGSVRLYLMGVEDKFLYTRELVPGKWGFDAADLQPGDRYGETVFRLPSSGNSSQCFVAVTASGDQTMKDANGAVYILEISKKGNVNNYTKLSATAFLELVQEELREEQNSPAEQKNSEKHSPSPTLGLKHLNGVTSMVFFNSSGGVQAVINVKSSKEKDLLHNLDRHLQEDGVNKNTDIVGMGNNPSRMHSDGPCLFNNTHCDCMPETTGDMQEDCYEMFESKEEPGRALCLTKVCPPTYKCSCDGIKQCQRVDKVEDIYVPHAKEGSTEIFCTIEKRLVSKVVPVTKS